MTYADSSDTPETSLTEGSESPESSPDSSEASFGDILSQFEQTHHSDEAPGTVEGTVVSVTPEAVFVDIGRKSEGVLPPDPSGRLQPGVKVVVSIRGRDNDGNLLLSTIHVEIPKDWSGLEQAFANKTTVAGTVTEAVRGGLRLGMYAREVASSAKEELEDITAEAKAELYRNAPSGQDNVT